jgi:hypothetical protein
MKQQKLLKAIASLGLKKFPISFWNYTSLELHGQYMNEAEVESWADAGFTVPQGSICDPNNPGEVAHTRQMLDWAQQRGMKLIPWDKRCMADSDAEGRHAREGFRGRAEAAIRDFGDHPALFGFYVADEAANDGMYECHRIQRELAPHLHAYYNLLPVCASTDEGKAKDLDDFIAKCKADLLSYDCYTQMTITGAMLDDYYRNLRLFREASLRNGVPFWNTPMCVGHNQYRCPTFDDLRWQFNTSLASGANGIVWFFYYLRRPHANYRFSPVNELFERTQTYSDLRLVHKSFHRHYGDLFNRLASTRVSFYPKAFGGGETWTPNELVTTVWPAYDNSTPILIGEFVDAQGRRYVMIVNNSMTQTDRVLVKFPKKTRLYSWGWDGREYEGAAYCTDHPLIREEDGTVAVWHWLAPGQEAVYRVEIPTP